MPRISTWILLAGLFVTAPLVASEIDRDEAVRFFPGYAAQHQDGNAWMLRVHGLVYEPEDASALDAFAWRCAESIGEQFFGIGNETDFVQRLRWFTVDHEHGQRVAIRLGTIKHGLPPTAADGYFSETIRLPTADLSDESLERAEDGWLTFRAVLPEGDEREFRGEVQLIAPEGISIVSDIDDTIKVTKVGRWEDVVRSTLIEPFQAVEGMAPLYRAAQEQGACFHYLSGSPWQLYPALAEMLADEGFPRGSWHLRRMRPWHPLPLDSLGDHKAAVLRQLLSDFPRRQFILIGDDAGSDPEVYGAILREYPQQILCSYVRITGEEDRARLEQAFVEVEARRWRTFRHVREISPLLRSPAER